MIAMPSIGSGLKFAPISFKVINNFDPLEGIYINRLYISYHSDDEQIN